MKTYTIIILVMSAVITTHAQVDNTDLLGGWFCENNDSLYYKNTYVTLYNDSLFRDESNQCNFIVWTIDSDRVFISKVNKCVDDGEVRMSMSLLKYGIRIKKAGGKRIIEFLRGEEVYESFKVIAFQEQRVGNNTPTRKILKLKRV